MYRSKNDMGLIEGLKRLQEAYLILIIVVAFYLLISVGSSTVAEYIEAAFVTMILVGAVRLLSGLTLLGDSHLDYSKAYRYASKALRNTLMLLVADMLLGIINILDNSKFIINPTNLPVSAVVFLMDVVMFLTAISGIIFIIRYTRALHDIAEETSQNNYKYGATLLVFIIITGILIMLINHASSDIYTQIAPQLSLLTNGFYIINIISLYLCYNATSKSLQRF